MTKFEKKVRAWLWTQHCACWWSTPLYARSAAGIVIKHIGANVDTWPELEGSKYILYQFNISTADSKWGRVYLGLFEGEY